MMKMDTKTIMVLGIIILLIISLLVEADDCG